MMNALYENKQIWLFLHITENWVFKLYKDYIDSIYDFLKNNKKNIIFEEYQFEPSIESKSLNKFFGRRYSKIIFSGNISKFIEIYNTFNIENLKNIYFLNIEQMAHYSYYRYFRNIPTNLKILDYSEENIPYLEGIYKKTFLVPPTAKSYYTNETVKKNNILTFTNNDYRKKIVQKLKRNDITCVEHCFGEERDKMFAETKIYLNIHCSDRHNTSELIRIVNLIMNRVIVISQYSVKSELLYMDPYIFFCDTIEDMRNTIQEVLDNYDEYFKKIYSSFNEKNYLEYVGFYYDRLIEDV